MEKINIAEILKDAPKGTELWSPIVGNIALDGIRQDHPSSEAYIEVRDNHNNLYTFMETGEIFATDNYTGAIPIFNGGICVLFPSKDNLTWENFKAPWKHIHFEPFEKVLVKGTTDGYYWWAALYSHYDTKRKLHMIAGGGAYTDEYILPFEGNEDKLGKPVK